MYEETEALVVTCMLCFNGGCIPCPTIFGDGTRHSVVKASVQSAKIIGRDWRVALDGQFGNSLTDIAVVVNDLRHCKSSKQQIVSMLQGGLADRGAARRAPVQDVKQLIEENGNAVIDLGFGGWRDRSARDLRPAAADDLIPVGDDEFEQHRS